MYLLLYRIVGWSGPVLDVSKRSTLGRHFLYFYFVFLNKMGTKITELLQSVQLAALNIKWGRKNQA